MNFNNRQILIIQELNLESELVKIQNLETEIQIIEQNLNKPTQKLKQKNQAEIQTNLQNHDKTNLQTKQQELTILKANLAVKIQKNWQIYQKKPTVQKFCPYVQIKLCDGICGHFETLENYNLKIDQIKTILGGKIKKAKLFLQNKINTEIERQNYPLAALWRDRMKTLEDLTVNQNVILEVSQDLDLLVLVLENLENGLILGSVFCQNIREGKIVNVSNYLLAGSSSGENQSEIAFSFWQRFLSSFVVSNINLAPIIFQTFWNENND